MKIIKNTKLLIAAALFLISIFTFAACGNEATISSIKVKTPATKLEYELNEDISYAGLIIEKVMSNGSKEDLTAADYAITTDYNKTVAGTYTVTITLKSDDTKTTSYTVTVNAEPATVSSIRIKTKASKTVFAYGTDISYAGLVIEKVMSDDTAFELAAADYTITTDYNKTVAGTYAVTITLKIDNTKTVEYDVKVNPQGTIRIILEDASNFVEVDIEDFEYLADVLLSDTYSGELEADIELGAYGYFINSLKGVVPNPESEKYEYVGVYSTLIEYYSEDWGTTKIIDGITYYSCSVGISSLPIVKDASYLFVIEVFE